MSEGTPARDGGTRVVAAAAIGNFMEFYDFILFGFFAGTLAALFFPAGNATTSLLLTLATFGVASFTRPLGALVVGAYCDRAGRKAGLTVTILMMAASTALIGFLPTYGRSACWRRCCWCGAFAAGGEFGGATVGLPDGARPGTLARLLRWLVAERSAAIAADGLRRFTRPVAGGCTRLGLAGAVSAGLLAPVGVYTAAQPRPGGVRDAANGPLGCRRNRQTRSPSRAPWPRCRTWCVPAPGSYRERRMKLHGAGLMPPRAAGRGAPAHIAPGRRPARRHLPGPLRHGPHPGGQPQPSSPASPGCAHLRDTGLFFPIDPGADASLCGMAATRASGTNAVRYGTMRDNVVALTAVLPDGEVLVTGSRARKSAAGYDLTRLLVGSAGTLAVITSATLRLHPVPEQVAAGVCAFATLDGACTAASEAISAGIPIARIELLDGTTVRMVNAYAKLGLPVAPTLFVEFHGSPAAVAEQAALFREVAEANGATGVETVGDSEGRARLWRARHEVSSACRAWRPG